MRFRNLDISPKDRVESWPLEAVATALERGGISEWRRLAVAIEDDPYGEVARAVEEAMELVDGSGIRELMAELLSEARQELESSERARVADEIRRCVESSGLSAGDFARRIGTSASRLSTYLAGRVTPSAAMFLRIGDVAKALPGRPSGAGPRPARNRVS